MMIMIALHISQIYHIFLPRVHSSIRTSSGISFQYYVQSLQKRGEQSYLFNERSIIYSTKLVLHYYFLFKKNVEFFLSFPPADFLFFLFFCI